MSKKSNKYAGDQPAAYDPTGVSEYLGLGRPIDFDKKPVRIAMMCAVAISVVVTLWKCSTGMDSGAAVVSALGYALSSFSAICWLWSLTLTVSSAVSSAAV